MTQAELIAKLNERRLIAFSAMSAMASADARYLASCGYRGKTNAEAVLGTFLHYSKEIDKLERAWEKANPLK